MKKSTLIIIAIVISINTFSQDIFQKTIGSFTHNEYAYNALELPSGGFILTNFKGVSTSNAGNPYLIKISKNGTLVSDNYIQDTSINFFYSSILTFNSRTILFGTLIDRDGNYSDSLVFSEIDTNLNIISTNKVHFANYLNSGNFHIDNYKDSLLVVSGYLDSINQKNLYNPFVITLDTNYTITNINNHLFDGYNYMQIYNLVYNNFDSLFYSFLSINPSYSYKIRLDLDLIVDSVYLQNSYSFGQPIYLQSINDHNYMIAWDSKKKVILYRLNSSFDTISSKQLGSNSILVYPAPSRSLSANSIFIFGGLTENLNPNNIWWGLQNSNFYVAKMDSLGNTIWDKRIGSNGNYYILYDVLATKDGGCLLSGCVYDYTSSTFQKDLFIAKLDSNGATTWTKNVDMPEMEISIFPNPTHRDLYISSKNPYELVQSIRVLDLSGKEIINQAFHSNSHEVKINVSNFDKGVFILEIKYQSGKVFIRKFIKN